MCRPRDEKALHNPHSLGLGLDLWTVFPGEQTQTIKLKTQERKEHTSPTHPSSSPSSPSFLANTFHKYKPGSAYHLWHVFKIPKLANRMLSCAFGYLFVCFNFLLLCGDIFQLCLPPHHKDNGLPLESQHGVNQKVLEFVFWCLLTKTLGTLYFLCGSHSDGLFSMDLDQKIKMWPLSGPPAKTRAFTRAQSFTWHSCCL